MCCVGLRERESESARDSCTGGRAATLEAESECVDGGWSVCECASVPSAVGPSAPRLVCGARASRVGCRERALPRGVTTLANGVLVGSQGEARRVHVAECATIKPAIITTAKGDSLEPQAADDDLAALGLGSVTVDMSESFVEEEDVDQHCYTMASQTRAIVCFGVGIGIDFVRLTSHAHHRRSVTTRAEDTPWGTRAECQTKSS